MNVVRTPAYRVMAPNSLIHSPPAKGLDALLLSMDWSCSACHGKSMIVVNFGGAATQSSSGYLAAGGVSGGRLASRWRSGHPLPRPHRSTYHHVNANGLCMSPTLLLFANPQRL